MLRSSFPDASLPRRRFLGAACALGAASVLPQRAAAGGPSPRAALLAIEGGQPIRERPLRAGLYGPQFFDDEEKKELIDVLESRSPFRWWGSGPGAPPKVKAFEAEYAQHVGTKYALGVTSGTTALMTAMAALEVGPGDEVILPAWTWYACYDAVVLAGALPVFAEIDDSFGIDPDDIEHRITPQTKVLMTVHLQGTPCDMDRLLPLARKHGLKVLEDCAQCAGGLHRKRGVGSMGDIGIFSFQVNKVITAGEGGAVVTSDPVLFERAMKFHDVGMLRLPYLTLLQGGSLGRFSAANFRMSEFTGAVLRGQLRKLETIAGRLRRAARIVREGIADLPGLKLRRMPDPEGDLGTDVFLDLGSGEKRDRFLRAMAAEGVPAFPPRGSAILPAAPHIRDKLTVHPDWPSFRSTRGKEIRYGAESCPRTIDILGRHAGVVLDPNFTDEDLGDIVRAIRKVYAALA
ncbi:MAG: DegT/DnrJ/EryC1/StrS family aminotransferase [Planctomycetes bacterium]|nr:DegT/DnrJ/EryC1/StrS family aminotransferase [Planctomycetota bacterium]